MDAASEQSFRYHQVEQRILGMIESGDLRSGDKLPSLRRVCSSMRVSMSTATHAYEELERKGVIESRPRSGFFVRTRFRKLLTPKKQQPQSIEPTEVNRIQLIRTVLDTIGDRKLIPFGVVTLAEELLPTRVLARLLSKVAREHPGASAAYETVAGNYELRRQIAFRSLDAGSSLGPDDLMITAGAMEGLYTALMGLTRAGDTVLIQSPAYYCFLQLLEGMGLRAIELPSDPNSGISPADLADAVKRFQVKLAILCPNFNNPDGSLTPQAAKREIVELLAKREIPLVEDDVYGELYFEGARPDTFKSYDTKGLVIYCSSFSKTIAPGYRIGWMAPGRFLAKTLEVKATTNVCVASPTQLAIAEYLRVGQYDRHLKIVRNALMRQMQGMQLSIGEHFPHGARVTHPKGGGVLWLELPEHVDSVKLFFKARNAGISIVPGEVFSTGDNFNNFIRLSVGGVWSERLQKGLETLGALAHECCQE